MQKENEDIAKYSSNDEKTVLDSGEIINRVKLLLGIDNDMKLAHAFKMSQNTIYSWRARNNADIGLIIAKIATFFPRKVIAIDYNWLLTGKGISEIIESVENSNVMVEVLKKKNSELEEELKSRMQIINGLIEMLGKKMQ